MAYDTTEAVAKFLSGFQMKITNRERDTVAPDYYVKYSLTLSKGGKDFSTTFVSDGEPTVTQVFSALADDALTLRKYSTDEFVDKLYAQGVKPSAALRAYDSCKETNLWMQDELYLSGWEIEEISKTLTKYEDEVNTLVEKAASERAARYAYDHPKLPKGFVTIEQLQGDLDLGDLRDEVEDFDFDGDITEAFGETADDKVDSKGRYLQDGSDGAVRVLQVRPLRPSRGYLPLRHPRPAKGYGGLCHPGKPCRRNLKRPLL